MKYEYIVRAITDEPWAIVPEKLHAICEFINLKISGVEIPYEAAARPEERRTQNVAVLPLFGVMAHRSNMITSMSGGTSLDKFNGQLMALVRDPEIGAIILDIDSPGGSVAGVEEAGTLIAAAAKRKPIIAHANATAASAAYWLASQTSEFWMTPSGQVGSIGVLAVHHDVSQAMEKDGIKSTFITAGKFKAEGSPERPLTEEAQAYMQARVDQYYDSFVKAVARGRKVSEKEVRGGFGQGRVVGAREALQMGMVDHVGTLDDVLASLVKTDSLNGNGKRAEDLQPPVKSIAAQIDEDLARMFWIKEQYEGE